MKDLPIKQDITQAYRASLLIALLVAIASVLGLAFTDQIYPSEELIQSFLTNDAINIIVGLPVLLGSLWLVKRGKLLGLLFWPGALFFMVYNYLIYLVAMPINMYYIFFPLIVFPSLYITIWLIRHMNAPLLASNLAGNVPERFTALVLVGFGIIFISRVAAIVVAITSEHLTIPPTELGLHIADVFFSIVLLICGIQLWRKHSLGYCTGLGLLFQASMLFIGLILLMLLQPIFTGEPIPWIDILIVFLMGFITFIPFGFYIRGVNQIEL